MKRILLPFLSGALVICSAAAQSSSSGGASSASASGASGSAGAGVSGSTSAGSGLSGSSTTTRTDSGLSGSTTTAADTGLERSDSGFSDSGIDYATRQPGLAGEPRDSGFSDNSMTTPEEDSSLSDDRIGGLDDRDLRSGDADWYSNNETPGSGSGELYDPRDSTALGREDDTLGGDIFDPDTGASSERDLSQEGLAGRLRDDSGFGGSMTEDRIGDDSGFGGSIHEDPMGNDSSFADQRGQDRPFHYGEIGDDPSDDYGPFDNSQLGALGGAQGSENLRQAESVEPTRNEELADAEEPTAQDSANTNEQDELADEDDTTGSGLASNDESREDAF